MQDTAPICMIGFGEAAQAFVAGWRSERPDLPVSAFDIKTADPASASAKHDDYRRARVDGHDAVADALARARLVFSLVTADQAMAAAKETARFIAPGTCYFDGNSCAPSTKQSAARAIEAAGGRYVDLAIMAPVHPKQHRVPLLASGPHEAEAIAGLSALGMQVRGAGDAVGRASSIKMLRSVMIKGIEALTLESLLAARRAGVEDEVIASLDASMPGWDWRARAAYNIERVTTHGTRRAAEMREVAQSVADLSLPCAMSEAAVAWQQTVGALGLAPGPVDFAARADALLAALQKTDQDTDKET